MPLVSVTASGGARMQEGILSLMQLPKTVCAVEDLHDAGCPMFSVMAHPTTGGVLASFASLGDVTIAEPGALIAFTGPRVVSRPRARSCRTTSALAEQNLRFGHVDAIVPRPEHAAVPGAAPAALWTADGETRSCGCASRLSRLARPAAPARHARLAARSSGSSASSSGSQADTTDEEIWRSVELARHPERPYTLDYVERILDDWVELHGDRGRADDGALVTGIGKLDGRTVALIGHQKGRDVKERLSGSSAWRTRGLREGDAGDGDRGALRLPGGLAGRHAGRLSGRRRRAARPGRRDRPLAGDDGRGSTVPTVACIIGEGGSGGAVAIARLRPRADAGERDLLGDPPEGCAAILWRDARRGEEGRRRVQAGCASTAWSSA